MPIFLVSFRLASLCPERSWLIATGQVGVRFFFRIDDSIENIISTCRSRS